MDMVTTIQISEELQKELAKRKFYSKETYEDVIWNLIEDTEEVSLEELKELDEIVAEVKKGKFYTLAQVKKELGL